MLNYQHYNQNYALCYACDHLNGGLDLFSDWLTRPAVSHLRRRVRGKRWARPAPSCTHSLSSGRGLRRRRHLLTETARGWITRLRHGARALRKWEERSEPTHTRPPSDHPFNNLWCCGGRFLPGWTWLMGSQMRHYKSRKDWPNN